MARKDTEYERFTAMDRGEWRQWLEENHADSPGVWLVYYKKSSGRSRVGYVEAMEEALCYGWIDSRPNKLDDERAMQLFTPRKRGSVWSRLNKGRVERLISEGRMTPAGLAKIDAAKADGSWGSYDAAEEMHVPPDLDAAFAANPQARRNFDAFSDSSKKNILWYVTSAKRPETRARRVEETVQMAEQNLRANHYKQPKRAETSPSS